jgi:hypothetical protein
VLTLTPPDEADESQVLKDGEPVGIFEYDCRCPRADFPLPVRGLLIRLSSSRQPIAVYSHNLSVRVKGEGVRKRSEPSHLTIFQSIVEPDLPKCGSLSFKEAQLLTVGREIAVEYPFQRWANHVTNGKVWFPLTYPTSRADWRKLPVARFPEAMWESFLSWLEGKFLGEVIEQHLEVTDPVKHRRLTAPKLTTRQREINSIVVGQMWQGAGDCERLSLGKNIIFHARRRDGRIVHIVDNPGVGAIYVFEAEELEKAKVFASGAVKRRDARALGYRFIEHREGWQDRVRVLLNESVAVAS